MLLNTHKMSKYKKYANYNFLQLIVDNILKWISPSPSKIDMQIYNQLCILPLLKYGKYILCFQNV